MTSKPITTDMNATPESAPSRPNRPPMRTTAQIHAEIQILLFQRACRQQVIRAKREAIAETNAQILALHALLKTAKPDTK